MSTQLDFTHRPHKPQSVGTKVFKHAAASLAGGLLICATAWAQSPVSGVPAAAGAAAPQVAPCSWTPNCVSSYGKPGESKYIAPLRPRPAEKEPMKRLKSVVSAMPGAKLVVEQPFLLKYEFTTAKMKFIDDVQFSFSPRTGLIEMRSASRIGISDFGVNRDRLDRVRSAFESAGAP